MNKKRGITLIEVVIFIGLAAAFGTIAVLNLLGRKNVSEFDATVKQVVALLREAQSRSVAQSDSVGWGVHFENSTATAPFYALFRSSYSVQNRVGYYRLPSTVGYATTSVALGASKDIIFTQITGAVNASTSVGLLLLNDPAVSSTIYVASSGAVRF